MEQKKVGYLIVGISALLGMIIYSFNRALTDIVSTACSHGQQCPMWGTITLQTNISVGIMLVIMGVGIFMILSRKRPLPRRLDEHERKLVKLIEQNQGTMFQSDIVQGTGYTKVKVTRILDRLEGKGEIYRKRRGMTNVVILKE